MASAADPAPAASDDEFAKVVRPFLQRHCLACHGADKQQAERRFDQLDGAIRDDNSVTDYQDMLDQLNLGAMPPKEAPQPTTA
ncbi:MAG: hypothetical protein KDB14_05675, partial [Planctomycetales bacterium]|nr:hypothetical protein [Planctomycetales bacterium]